MKYYSDFDYIIMEIIILIVILSLLVIKNTIILIANIHISNKRRILHF